MHFVFLLFACQSFSMSIQWFVDVQTLETGTLRFRNWPLYNSISEKWWPISRCFNCYNPHKGGFLGYMLDYVPSSNLVHMVGAGTFCTTCERRSRAVTRALNRFDLIARSLRDWDTLTSRNGEYLFPQIYQYLATDPIVVPFPNMFKVLFDFEYKLFPPYLTASQVPPKEYDMVKVHLPPFVPPLPAQPPPSHDDGILIVEDG